MENPQRSLAGQCIRSGQTLIFAEGVRLDDAAESGKMAVRPFAFAIGAKAIIRGKGAARPAKVPRLAHRSTCFRS
jgi:hypothetical protein